MTRIKRKFMKRITRMMIAFAVLLVGSTAAWAGDEQSIRLVITGSGTVTIGSTSYNTAGAHTVSTNTAAGTAVTMTVAPGNGQYVDVLSVNKTVDIPSPSPAPSRRGGVGSGYVALTKTTGTGYAHESNTYTFTMPSSDYSGVNIVVTFAARTSVSTTGEGAVTIDNIANQTYTGLAVTPEVTVKHGTDELTAGDDYTVEYANNTNAGNATATVSFIGKYDAGASTLSKEFVIDKAPLTVTAKPKTITYGDAPANDGVEYAGFVNSENESVLTGTVDYAYNYTQFGNVGSYTITPSGLSSSNYDITFTAGTLTVNKATLTITADNKSVRYGEAAPEYTVSYSGFVNSETASVLGGFLNIACTYAQNDNVGTYVITPSGFSAQNYVITYVGGTLTVSLASLTLADNADNNNAINDVISHYGRKADVTLSGRTLTANNWNTLCLPFDLSSAQIASIFGNGTKVKTLSDYSSNTTKVTVSFADAATIEAGKPYIIKPTNTVENPVFADVTIDKTMNDVTVGGATFKGTYGPVVLTANDKRRLFLANNTLWYPTAELTVRTCRAYFELTNEVPETAGAPSIVIDYGEATSLTPAPSPTGEGSGYWYTLDGRRLDKKPTQKGIYVKNGRKVVVK